ncbi:MAG: ribonuclease R [PS1 clade bacterium]|nr:ribonuclease R [PS1 clade bacterium]MBL6784189.1 ribonuclease R [PS1 clade bacterium]
MGTIPTRDEILKFIADRTGETTKRDIAKAFNIKGADRIPLKRLLREMSAEGLLEGSRKSGMRGQGDLPNVSVVQVTGRNKEGYLVARARHEGKLLDGPQDPIIEIDDSAPRNRRHRPSPPVSPGDTALARLRRVDKDTYIARVIRKLGDAGGRIIGVVRERNDGLWLIPADRRERYDYQLEKDTKAAHGDLLICEKLPGPRMGTKRAKLKENIGAADDPHAFSLISIAEQGLPTVFPDAVMAEAEAVTEADATGREDLTALPFITIDPADARDHDDAVFAEPDPDNEGGYIVWVAIADVAAYVKPASEMDVEARKRGNSVYMPDRVVPMLPERLSNDLCSLRENETRPCMAVRMQIAANGQKTGHQFYRGLMRSVAKLSYAEAQHAFDGDCLPAFTHLNDTVLQPLWQAYQCMVEAREQRQPLRINRPERRIEMDDKGKITRIYIPPSLEAHKLIEEMMVTANVCAAETLEKAKRPLIYRVHDTPPDDRVRALSDFLRSMNVKLSLGQTLLPKLFNGLMEQAADQPYAPTISEAVLRTQAQAVYTIENIGHFGLNLGRYAHFTSPIRRYADLTVHRALIAALKAGKDGQTDAEAEALPDIAEAISQTERRAMLAERSAGERYLSAHMSSQIGESFSARISGVSRAGLFVTLDDSGADGLIPISQLGDERFYADESNMFMTGGTSGISFRIGESVEVELEEATPLKGGLLFSLVDGGTYGGKQKRGPKKRGAFRRPPRHRPRGRR